MWPDTSEYVVWRRSKPERFDLKPRADVTCAASIEQLYTKGIVKNKLHPFSVAPTLQTTHNINTITEIHHRHSSVHITLHLFSPFVIQVIILLVSIILSPPSP